MHTACLDHVLTTEERAQFERDGFFVIQNALPDELVNGLRAFADDVDKAERARLDCDRYERMNHYDVIGRDPRLLELLDWPTTIAKIWGILGWNIQLYHTHLTVNPSAPSDKNLESDGLELGWHQDSGQINVDLETSPRPRVSLKVGYFLSDTSEPGRGNFYVLPGSHLSDEFPGGDRKGLPKAAIPICVTPGTAVFFDRRLWHSGSTNYWHEPRRVLFYGYSYRWLRPRDDMQIAHYLPDCDPIRRQLLGESPTGGRGFTSPTEADVPLKSWIETHVDR